MKTRRWIVSLPLAAALASRTALADEPPQPSLANWDAPAEWAAAAGTLPTNPLTFVGIVPCRLADTRDGALPPGYGPPALTAGSVRNVVLTGRCGIPATALAVSANMTVVNPPGPGFLLIRPTDGPNVVVSTLNFIPGQTIANGAVVPLGTGGSATFLAGVTGTDLIIDVNGYYVEPPVVSGGDITSVNAGAGLMGGGTAGDVSLTIDTAATQARVSGSCPAGQSIRAVNQNGTVVCEPDDAGTGTVTSVGSGSGLSGGPITTSGTLSVSFAGSGVSATAARSDHNHLGQIWVGGASNGLNVQVTGAGETALLGYSNSGSGVYGQSDANNQPGVEGAATANSGIGVRGVASATSGINFGVHGSSSSAVGYAGYFQGRLGVTGDVELGGQFTSYATATVAATGDGVSNSTQAADKRFCALVRMNQGGAVNTGTNYSCSVSKSGSTFTLTARASSASHTVTCDMACF